MKILVIVLVSVQFIYVNGGKCGVVSIKDWGGRSPSHVEYMARPVDLVIIQHTVTGECSKDDECASIARAIQSNHMVTLKWDNIGQSFLVGGNGKVYEGSGWLHVGAHSYGYNRRSIGLSFIGDFRTKLPSDAALQAAKDLMKCGVQKKYLTSDYYLVAHRQLSATESPGAMLYNDMKDWPHWAEDVSTIPKH